MLNNEQYEATERYLSWKNEQLTRLQAIARKVGCEYSCGERIGSSYPSLYTEDDTFTIRVSDHNANRLNGDEHRFDIRYNENNEREFAEIENLATLLVAGGM